MKCKHIFSLFLIATAFLVLFTACSFRVTPKPSTPDDTQPENIGTIKVDVTLSEDFSWGGSTARHAKIGDDDSRAAVPSEFPTEDSAKLVFAGAVHAEGSLDSSMLREGVCTYDTSTGIVSIELPFPISNVERKKLTIYAFAHGTTVSSITNINTTALLVGDCEVLVPANSVTATISDNTLIKMKPNTYNTLATGTVNLSIKIPKVYFLSADNSDLSLVRAAAADGDTIEYTISGTVSAGSPNVTFSLLKTDGNKSSAMFSWSETINVLPGLTTNKWTSNGVGEVDGKTKIISEITIASTFYVCGIPESGNHSDSWFAQFEAVDGTEITGDDDNGTGSLAKPFATVQKAVDKVLAVSNGTADESYTIFVDGKITATTTDTAPMADFSRFSSGCSITLKGLDAVNKATLDGNNTVQGIVVGSYDGSSGPAINVNLTLENLIITKCATSEYGAGILLSGNNTTTHKISNCEISGNTATKKGCGICNYQTNLIINDTTISENTTDEFGGGIYNIYGTATFTNSTISGNTAKDHGGGIYTRGTITITNSTVSGNKANDGAGGGIFIVGDYTMGIINSTISENTATSDVGGGLFATDSSTVNISDSTFSGNTATKGGGAIYNNTGVSATISDCIISGNKVTGSSGKGNAIYHDGRALNLSGSTQIESVGSDANDVYLYSSSKKITITGTLTPPDSSKPVAIITPYSYTSGNTVLNATAGDGTNSDANKALLEANYNKFSITQETDSATGVTSDWFITSEGRLSLGTVYLHSGVIDSANSGNDTNSGSLPGKAVKTLAKAREQLGYAAENPKIVVMDKPIITTDDPQLLDFSGKFPAGSTKTVTFERYYKDASTLYKDVLVEISANCGTEAAPVILKNITLDGNWKANGGTGAVQISSDCQTLLSLARPRDSTSVVEIGENTVLKNNYGESNIWGAGIVIWAGTLKITGGEISGNISANGGAIYNVNNGTLKISGGTITGNIATENGGVVRNSGSMEISGGTITGNTANGEGGAVYNSGTLKISGGTISDNTGRYGGAIINYNSVIITDGEISRNTATSWGGGIYNVLYDDYTVTITGGKITGNTATRGKGIYNAGTLNFSGAAQIDENNDVCFDNGKIFKITGDLMPPDSTKPVAVITPSNGINYAIGTQVAEAVYGDGTNNDANAQLLSENVGKFAVTPQVKADSSIVNWEIDNEGKLRTIRAKIATVYLNNTGCNDTNSGSSATASVASLKVACESLDYTAENPTIFVCKPYTLAADEAGCFDFSGKFASGSTKTVLIKRYYESSSVKCSGTLFNTGTCTNITMKNVVIDGDKEHISSTVTDGSAAFPLVNVKAGSTVTLGANATLQNDADRAIYNLGTFIIDGGIIKDINTAGGKNGAVWNINTFEMKSGSISNTAGSAIYSKGTVTISGGTISGNNAENGGAIYLSEGTVTISGGTLSGNTATVKGGAIHCKEETTLSMSGGEISGNSVTLTADITPANGDGGGGISADNATINISGNAKISGNKVELTGIKSGAATNIFRGGGGICAINNSTITISDTAEISSNIVNIDETNSFRSSYVYLRGAGIALNTGVITINDSAKLTKNIANKCTEDKCICYGGAIELYSGTLNINGGEISQNKAYNGGAVNTSNEYTINMSSGLVSKNIAYNHGGAFSLSSAGSKNVLNLTGGTITENSIEGTAGEGEAINLHSGVRLIISGSPIIDSSFETGNNIYTTNSIKISGPLTLPSGASAFARVNLPPSNYTPDQVVLQADGTNLTELTDDICKMFILNASGDSKTTNTDFGIGLSGDKKKGVLTKIAANGIASLPDDKMNFTLRVKPNGAVNSIPYNSSYAARAGDKFSFSVENTNGDAIPSNATYKIAIMKNGVELSGYTQTSTGSAPEIEVPAKFANLNMSIDIYMSITFTVGGVTTTFDDTVSAKTVKEVVVTAADFADYFDALVSAKVPDIYVTVDVSNGADLKTIIAEKLRDINNNGDINSVNLKISGTITEISEDDTFKGCEKLVSVTLPSSITYVANWTFQNCTALKYVYIPNSVTELGNGVFNGCSSLEEITIPSSVTNIGCSFFKGCTHLKTITFTATTAPEFYTAFDISFENVPSTCVARVPNSKLSDYETALRAMDNSIKGVGFPGTIVGY